MTRSREKKREVKIPCLPHICWSQLTQPWSQTISFGKCTQKETLTLEESTDHCFVVSNIPASMNFCVHIHKLPWHSVPDWANYSMTMSRFLTETSLLMAVSWNLSTPPQVDTWPTYCSLGQACINMFAAMSVRCGPWVNTNFLSSNIGFQVTRAAMKLSRGGGRS